MRTTTERHDTWERTGTLPCAPIIEVTKARAGAKTLTPRYTTEAPTTAYGEEYIFVVNTSTGEYGIFDAKSQPPFKIEYEVNNYE